MHLDLKRLGYFKAIVEAASLSEAARQLSVPQPALSYHLKALEADFGAPLLVRSRSGVRVTEGGQLLLDHATIILAQVARASAEMQRLKRRGPADPGIMRISALPSLATPLVPLLLQHAARRLTMTGLYIIEATTNEAQTMLREDKIDFAIVIADDTTPNQRLIANERLLFAMAQDNPDRSTDPITLRDALREPLLLPSAGKPVRVLVETLARQIGSEVRVTHEIDGPHPRKHAVMAGLARSFLPWIAIRDEVAKGEIRFRDVVEPPLERDIALESRDDTDPVVADALQHMLQEILCPILRHPDGANERPG